MSELPKERVEISEPFMYSGMDCFGPFVTKQGRKEHKTGGSPLTLEAGPRLQTTCPFRTLSVSFLLVVAPAPIYSLVEYT
uniref:Uncharacterized protein n=1 Tax=Knipowitschia caucasica TaxID=637954 RepID=A0AAV2IWR9_KNICA